MINNVAVTEDTERHGVGTALVSEALRRARDAGVQRIIAGSTSPEATKFLQAQGMTAGRTGEALPANHNNGFSIIIDPHQRNYGQWCWMELSEA